MLKAVARHTDQKWIVLYVERWLKAPMQRPDGTLVPRVKGTPQGSPMDATRRLIAVSLSGDAAGSGGSVLFRARIGRSQKGWVREWSGRHEDMCQDNYAAYVKSIMPSTLIEADPALIAGRKALGCIWMRIMGISGGIRFDGAIALRQNYPDKRGGRHGWLDAHRTIRR